MILGTVAEQREENENAERKSIVKPLLAAAFLLVLAVFFVKTEAWKQFGPLFETLKRAVPQSNSAAQTEKAPTFAQIEENFTSNLWKRTDMIDLTGVMAKALHMQGYYSDQDIFIMSDGTILDSSAKTTTDYEVEQTVALRDFLAERKSPALCKRADKVYRRRVFHQRLRPGNLEQPQHG